MWRKIRIGLLLFLLVSVAETAWLQTRDLRWTDGFYVAIYPINADGSHGVDAYIKSLTQEQFAPMARYFDEEAARHGLPLAHPFEFYLGPQIADFPPELPRSANWLDAVLWSLRFRWWAWNNSPPVQMPPKIWLYLMYHDPKLTPSLAHSSALSKGRIGLVNVFAASSQEGSNLVVIAHELLHTLGATDKYEPGTNLPQFPEGYAEPDKDPRYPQDFAELMGGRTPVAEDKAVIPASLADTLVGTRTATEIRWLQGD